jgi:hypothetical protein
MLAAAVAGKLLAPAVVSRLMRFLAPNLPDPP